VTRAAAAARAARPGSTPAAAAAAPAPAAPGDLLGLDDLLGGAGGGSNGGGAGSGGGVGSGAADGASSDGLFGLDAAAPAAAAPPPPLALAPAPALAPADFQARWVAMPVAARFTHGLSPATLAALEANAHQARGGLQPLRFPDKPWHAACCPWHGPRMPLCMRRALAGPLAGGEGGWGRPKHRRSAASPCCSPLQPLDPRRPPDAHAPSTASMCRQR